MTARTGRPFIKKFVEERELTLLLVVDVSASGEFGSGAQSKRELAAEVASVLAFSAIRNSDKVGLLLFSDQVELYVPPRKGAATCCGSCARCSAFEPAHCGTELEQALDFVNDVVNAPRDCLPALRLPNGRPASERLRRALRQTNRRHDLVALPIEDARERRCPTWASSPSRTPRRAN